MTLKCNEPTPGDSSDQCTDTDQINRSYMGRTISHGSMEFGLSIVMQSGIRDEKDIRTINNMKHGNILE